MLAWEQPSFLTVNCTAPRSSNIPCSYSFATMSARSAWVSRSSGTLMGFVTVSNSSSQVFYPQMVGNAQCFGHVQCDSIIMDQANIRSIPAITANSTEAQLIHEAAIGKIAGDQLLKLETLGLTEEEAEDCILKGFLSE